MKKRYECADCKEPLYKKDSQQCSSCGKTLCSKHVYYYVDGNNAAITRNAKGHCKECYERTGLP